MIYFLYKLFGNLILPLAFLRLHRKGNVTPAYRERWSERKGITPFKLEKSIWVHAVSLGESIAASTMIHKLIEDHPNTPIVVTTTTPTGSNYIRGRFGDRVQHCYFPYDIARYWERFLKNINPQILLLMETELWPTCLQKLHEKKVPVLLVNARLSEKSYHRYAKFKSLSHQMVNQLHSVIAQTKNDKSRFEKLGTPTHGVFVTGSSKFDIDLPEGIDEKASQIKAKIGDRPIWIGASTHEGEEAYLLDAHRALLNKVPDALLIIVPRHPERFDEVKALVSGRGYGLTTRSSQENCPKENSVFVGDSMGEMFAYYKVADIAFVGGSLVAVGGHNLLEAAALAKPILTGPYLHNFELIAKILVKNQACSVVHKPSEMAIKLEKLCLNEKLRSNMGAAGARVVSKNRGAFARQYEIINKVLTS